MIKQDLPSFHDSHWREVVRFRALLFNLRQFLHDVKESFVLGYQRELLGERREFGVTGRVRLETVLRTGIHHLTHKNGRVKFDL